MATLSISVIIVAMNEAHDIGDCIRSVRDWCQEVIVFDSGSQDGTQDLCRELGATVYETDWPGDGPQKNRALAKATGDWVICLDADEQISPALREEILRTLPDTRCAAFSTPRLSSFCGQEMRHSGWWPDRIVRVFRREGARFTDLRTHTRVVVDGITGSMQAPILHRAIVEISESLDKLNVYSSEGANARFAKGRRASLGSALLHGGWAFVRTYILKLGILDGRLGFVLAVLVAQESYYRHLKLWLKGRDAAGR